MKDAIAIEKVARAILNAHCDGHPLNSLMPGVMKKGDDHWADTHEDVRARYRSMALMAIYAYKEHEEGI